MWRLLPARFCAAAAAASWGFVVLSSRQSSTAETVSLLGQQGESKAFL
jgi:hypothetical protein